MSGKIPYNFFFTFFIIIKIFYYMNGFFFNISKNNRSFNLMNIFYEPKR